MNFDLLIPSVLLLTGSIGYRFVLHYSDREEVRLKTELDAIQIRASLFSSKVAIVEQYIEEFWKVIPTDEQEEIEELFLTRAYLESVMQDAWGSLKGRDHPRTQLIIDKLRGCDVSIDEEFDQRPIVMWEQRTHKLILRVCQKLTIEASVSKNRTLDHKYKRTPTLLSLKEISELLREEKGMRHEIARLGASQASLESNPELY